jgi:hypothetical protein
MFKSTELLLPKLVLKLELSLLRFNGLQRLFVGVKCLKIGSLRLRRQYLIPGLTKGSLLLSVEASHKSVYLLLYFEQMNFHYHDIFSAVCDFLQKLLLILLHDEFDAALGGRPPYMLPSFDTGPAWCHDASTYGRLCWISKILQIHLIFVFFVVKVRVNINAT